MKRRVFFSLLALLCLGLFLLPAVRLAVYFQEGRRTEAAFQTLAQSAEESPQQKPPAQDAIQENEQAPSLPAYESLHERNPDYWGWLRIEGTQIDYPVMYTPEEPEKYLHRDFDGNPSARGVPFLDASCTGNCGNYLLYGHHMKDGTMFGILSAYAKADYWAKHPMILLRTADGEQTYAVLAAFYAKVYDQEDSGVFRYYQYTDLTEPEVFDEYMARIQAAALYDTGVSAAYGTQLLTLSTCNYHTKNGRFVVVAAESGSPD